MGKKVSEIAKELQVSRKKVYNAIKSCVENPGQKPEAKTLKKKNLRTDATMVRTAKMYPFKSSRQIASDINLSFGLEISSRLVRRTLKEQIYLGAFSRKNK